MHSWFKEPRISSSLATLTSVLASVAAFATLHFTSSDVAYATAGEAATVRAGSCYAMLACPVAQLNCINHCKDKGCEQDAVVPYQLIPASPTKGYMKFQEPCVDEYNCTYDVVDTTQICTS